jgi:hypothetical protein
MGARLFSRRESELLNSLNARSNEPNLTPRPDGTIEAATVQLETSIVKSSFSLQQESPGYYALDFTFNALKDCEIAIYQFAEEVLDDSHTTLYYRIDAQKYSGPQILRFAKGLNQSLPPQSVVFDLTSFEEATFGSSLELIPLVIEIVRTTQRPVIAAKVSGFEATHLVFSRTSAGFELKVTCQKFTKLGRTFEVLDIFGNQGLESEEERSVCVICLTNLKDTLILPCRHLCLCHECANMTRAQAYGKCPICRVSKGYAGVVGLFEVS